MKIHISRDHSRANPILHWLFMYVKGMEGVGGKITSPVQNLQNDAKKPKITQELEKLKTTPKYEKNCFHQYFLMMSAHFFGKKFRK